MSGPMQTLRVVAAGGVGYALGAMPGAKLIASRVGAGHDLTAEGTGNPGAMNASHVLGKRWGAAVMAADVSKAAAAGRLGTVLAGDLGAHVAATAAVAGHCYPPGRPGGKGVSTSLGQVIATFPAYLPIDVGVAVGTSALPWFRQRTRVATTTASVAWVGCSFLWWKRKLPNPGGVTPTAALPIAAAVSSAVIAVRFRADAEKVAAYEKG
jgi:glycerol-3-phosphate acyltransferase PlsY